MPRFLLALLDSLRNLVSTLFYVGGWLSIVAVLVSTIAFFSVTEMPGSSKPAPAAALSAESQTRALRLQQDVTALSKLTRDSAHPAHKEAAARYIEAQLQDAGYIVSRQSYAAGKEVARNIYVTIPAVDNMHRRVLVVGVHYDQALGPAGGPNTVTGVAALLELARAYKHREALNADIQFVFYANGEAPYFGTNAMGSAVHARDLKDRGVTVVGMLALDSLGNFQEAPNTQRYPRLTPKLPLLQYRYPDTGNFVAFMGDFHSYGLLRRTVGAFRRGATVPSEGIPVMPATPGVHFSDHLPYVGEAYPALVVTDMAEYRTRQPGVDKIDYTKLALITDGLQQAVADLVL